jgi:hypothetical protein
VALKNQDVLEIKLGKIREDGGLTSFLSPTGEPSRGAVFQRFLWVRYTSTTGKQEEIYYPDLTNIQNAHRLVGVLKEKFGERVIVFDW